VEGNSKRHIARRLSRISGRAPSLPRHYPSSSLLRTPPTPDLAVRRLFIPARRCRRLRPHPTAPDRASQVPRLICRRPPSSLTPGSPPAAFARCFTDGTGFTISGCLAAPNCVTRPEQVHTILRLTSSFAAGSAVEITLGDAARTTCVSSNSHDELLSVHEINPTSLAHQITQISADFQAAPTPSRRGLGVLCLCIRSKPLKTPRMSFWCRLIN